METYYTIGKPVKRRPIVRKLGALCLGMEQTPVVFDGKLILIETQRDYGGGEHQLFMRAHDYRNDIVYPAFAHGCNFASAYTENGVVYAFGTTSHQVDPYRLGGGPSVMMFWSADLKNWESREIISLPHWRLFNTSVCKGPDGYVMAIEVKQFANELDDVIGHPFTEFFARSKNLFDWEMMDTDCHYTRARYNACPALRYFDGWYYMICLEALPVLRYAPYVYRTKNFMDWDVGIHNPVMMYDDEDRIPHPLSNFTEKQLELLETGLNINNSDVDLCEFEGKTYLYYANGDQQSYCFLCEAVYDGPLDEFLRRFFE